MLYPNRAIPAAILHRAKGIVILNQVQVSLVLGVKDGWGAAMIKKANGQWACRFSSRRANSALGCRARGQGDRDVYVLMD